MVEELKYNEYFLHDFLAIKMMSFYWKGITSHTDEENKEHIKEINSFINDFVKVGGNLHATNDINENVLHIAVRFGDLNIVKLLLEKGVPTDVKNYRGFTPITMCNDLQRPDIKDYFNSVIS